MRIAQHARRLAEQHDVAPSPGGATCTYPSPLSPTHSCPLQLKFPERQLTFKVESGVTAERDQWVASLQAARSAAISTQAAAAQATGMLQQLRKVRPTAAIAIHIYLDTSWAPGLHASI